jgi:hypothetical protein
MGAVSSYRPREERSWIAGVVPRSEAHYVTLKCSPYRTPKARITAPRQAWLAPPADTRGAVPRRVLLRRRRSTRTPGTDTDPAAALPRISRPLGHRHLPRHRRTVHGVGTPTSFGPKTGTPEEGIDHTFILYAGPSTQHRHRPNTTPNTEHRTTPRGCELKVSASAMSYESLLLPTETEAPASARRSV